MTPQRRHLPATLALGVLLGVGAAFVQGRLACRVADSEACVWGRAYLPVSLTLGAVAGLVVAAVAFIAVRLLRRDRITVR